MSSPPGASASIVRVTSSPDRVFRGAERVTVSLALTPVSRNTFVGEVESKRWLMVARMVKFPPTPLVNTEKGTEKGVPGTRMLLESA